MEDTFRSGTVNVLKQCNGSAIHETKFKILITAMFNLLKELHPEKVEKLAGGREAIRIETLLSCNLILCQDGTIFEERVLQEKKEELKSWVQL
jgi:hypothetical protein